MASPRNLAISALRTAGHTSIAAALRHMPRNPTLFGFTPVTSTNDFAEALPAREGGELRGDRGTPQGFRSTAARSVPSM